MFYPIMLAIVTANMLVALRQRSLIKKRGEEIQAVIEYLAEARKDDTAKHISFSSIDV
ncbi:hypothetical protein [Nostoc sp. CENA543]|uniref:hypothetical protein n=1 Tax=Nostoc sp. CENA543 TaxID=1869241 RepID=UPI0012FFEFBF|nr:hypothetical protein [Nostoc sp. CENA543]